MNQQEVEAKLEQAEALFKQTYIKLYLHEWWQEVMEKREIISPSDWLNVSIIMIEMMLDAQDLNMDQREKLAFEITQEIHSRLSKVNEPAEAS
jgi:hypothetical protein